MGGGGGGQIMLRGGGEGSSCSAHHSEQAVGCVVDGEGEWWRRSGPQERCGHSTCPSQPSNARGGCIHIVGGGGGGQSMLRGGGEGASCTAHHSKQEVGRALD